MKLRRNILVFLLLIASLAALSKWNSPTVRSQTPMVQRIESDAIQVMRMGNWVSQNASGASGGSYLFNSPSPLGGEGSGVGTALQLEFSGPSIEVMFVTGPSLGTLVINVDDIVLRTVITTAETTTYQQSSRIDYLSDEPHTLKVYAQAGGIVAIDAFVIPTSPPADETHASGQPRDGLGSGDWMATYVQLFPTAATCSPPDLDLMNLPSGSVNMGTYPTAEINFDWSNNSGPSYVSPTIDLFAIEFRRTVTFSENTTLTINHMFDDGIRMYDNGTRFVNRWGCGFGLYSVMRTFTAGTHELVVQYVENTGSANIVVSFQTPVLTATRQSDTQIDLAWNDVLMGETNYRVERSPDGISNWSEIATLPATTTTYQNIGLSCGTYYYRVRGYFSGSSSYSLYSNVANATTTACATAPSNLTAIPLDDGRIQLNWIDNASDETEYRLERSPDGLNNWMEIGIAPADTTTYTNVSLICGTPYHYRVRAYRASDMTYSAYSNVANATTSACPTSCAPIYGIARVSVPSSGGQGNDYSSYSDLSADGRYIVFESSTSNLVLGDTNDADDTFIRDNVTCQIWRVSVSSSGTEQNLYPNTDFVSISADGRYVAFKSGSTNLVPNDTNGLIDIFVHDRLLGQTRRISVANDGTQANGSSGNPVIAPGGRYVVFYSGANNLVPNDTNSLYDLFYYDLQTNTLTRVAISGFTDWVTLTSYVDLSSDGRYIVFSSPLNTVVAGDTNNVNDVFLYDRDTNQVTRISLGMGGAQGDGHSTAPSLSEDGRYVTYVSGATNLVPNDTNGFGDIFVYDRQTGQTSRVSVSSTGQQNNYSSEFPVMSGNGRYVAFTTPGTTLVMGDTNSCGFPTGCVDVFLHDRQTGQTVRLSDSNMGEQGNDRSLWPSISGDGHYVGFYSLATNLVEGDTNGYVDVMMVNTNRAFASDTLAIVNPATRSANLLETLNNPPAPTDYTQFATGFPHGTGGRYVTGDWNGDGLDTLGVYWNGAFFFTNDYGTGGTWGGVWFGLGGQPVVGRFDANVNHDCLGVTDSGTWVNGDTYFALYFTCNLTSGPTPPLTFQWLSILLPNSQGFTGTHQFVAGDFDGDGVDSVAVRRGGFIAWTNIPPTTLLSQFNLAQYIGAPGTGDEGKVVVGDWDLNQVDSFGLVYQNGMFYRRNDVEWNSGVYILQQFTPLVGTPFDVASWRPN